MGGREPFEHTATPGREVEAHDPAVVAVGLAADEASAFGSVHQLDGGVVADEEVLGDVPDRRRLRAGVAADGQEELVLLAGEAGLLGLLLAPAEELAQRRAEGEQVAVLVVAEAADPAPTHDAGPVCTDPR